MLRYIAKVFGTIAGTIAIGAAFVAFYLLTTKITVVNHTDSELKRVTISIADEIVAHGDLMPGRSLSTISTNTGLVNVLFEIGGRPVQDNFGPVVFGGSQSFQVNIHSDRNVKIESLDTLPTKIDRMIWAKQD